MRLRMVLLAMMLGATASASTIHYDESVSGDLPQNGSPLPIFVFDLGINTVTGHFSLLPDGTVDWDSFAFMIPAGAELVSGGVTYSNPTGSRIDLSWSLWKGSADSGAGTLVDTLAIDLANPGVLTNLPLGSDAYNVQAAHITAIVPSSTDYTFTFDVKPEAAAVPEPRAVSALAMFGLGLAAFARRQLRAQAKAA